MLINVFSSVMNKHWNSWLINISEFLPYIKELLVIELIINFSVSKVESINENTDNFETNK